MEELRGRAKVAAIFAIGYLVIFAGLVGWRDQHLYLLLLVSAMILIHRYSFYLLLAFSGVLGWTMLYDAMTFMPNYKLNDVHIKDLYDLEVQLFGIYESGRKVTLCEWFVPRYNDFVSFFLGFWYLLWIPAPMIYGVYLVFKKRTGIAFFAWAYFLTNVIGVLFYYLIPAAPPWYFLNHGAEVDLSVLGSAAGLAEFDRVVGVDIFQGIYSNNSNVFGAIPSLHAAYPLLCLLVARRLGHKGWVIFFAMMSVGTWIAAVYTQHHYVIDVLCGIVCALGSYYLMVAIVKSSVWDKIDGWYRGHLDVQTESLA